MNAFEPSWWRSAFRAGGVAQWLGALAALAEDLVLFPVPIWWLTPDSMVAPWDPVPSSEPPWPLGMHMVHRRTCR